MRARREAFALLLINLPLYYHKLLLTEVKFSTSRRGIGKGVEEMRLGGHGKWHTLSGGGGGVVGAVAAGADALAGGTHGEGGCRELHVEGLGKLERLELLQLLL